MPTKLRGSRDAATRKGAAPLTLKALDARIRALYGDIDNIAGWVGRIERETMANRRTATTLWGRLRWLLTGR